MFLLAACGGEQEGQNEQEEVATNEVTSQENVSNDLNYRTNIDQDYLDKFEEIDSTIENEIENNTYTIESPYVSLDPYGNAPLTAVVAFETENPTRAEVTIEGRTEETTITHNFEEMNTDHRLPILGLYPGEINQVQIDLYDDSDNLVEATEVAIETEALPEDFWSLDLAVESNKELMEPGLTFLMPSAGNLFAVDSLGEVRYYIEPWMFNTFHQLENGNLVMAMRGKEEAPNNRLVEMNLLGKPEQVISVEVDNYDKNNIFHHDLIELPNKNWLVLLHDGSEYIEDEMTEIDSETGEIVDRMNFKEVFSPSFYENYTGPSSKRGDWLHQNAVTLTDDEESVLVSARNQDMVMKLSYPEMETEWVLAADENWPEETNIKDYLLEPVGETMKFPTGQHAVEEMPDQDGNPDTMDIMLFDNNWSVTRGNENVSTDYSRSVQYRINETEGTVEEIWSYGEERGEDFFSKIVGDADLQPETDNVLMTSGRIEEEDVDDPESRIVEVTKEEEEVVFELVVSRFADHHNNRSQIYRAERTSLYPE